MYIFGVGRVRDASQGIQSVVGAPHTGPASKEGFISISSKSGKGGRVNEGLRSGTEVLLGIHNLNLGTVWRKEARKWERDRSTVDAPDGARRRPEARQEGVWRGRRAGESGARGLVRY